jgi:CDP-diacylglycerol--serine O-phosphatidyltransferase
LAVIAALEAHLLLAAILILVAALFDFADGMAARLLDATSLLGKQLDSLSDLVSFCVAPAVILYFLISRSISAPENVTIISSDIFIFLLPLSPVLLILAGGYRLARFNISASAGDFSGMPVPAMAIFISGLVLAAADPGNHILSAHLPGPWFYLTAIIILSILMISNLRLLSLKFRNFSYRTNQIRYLFLAFSAVLLVILKVAALPLIIVAYLLFSLINNLLVRKENRP